MAAFNWQIPKLDTADNKNQTNGQRNGQLHGKQSRARPDFRIETESCVKKWNFHMRAAHVGVMSAAAFGDLPTVTTVGKSVGTFWGNNDFCLKPWISLTESQRVVSEILLRTKKKYF